MVYQVYKEVEFNNLPWDELPVWLGRHLFLRWAHKVKLRITNGVLENIFDRRFGIQMRFRKNVGTGKKTLVRTEHVKRILHRRLVVGGCNCVRTSCLCKKKRAKELVREADRLMSLQPKHQEPEKTTETSSDLL